MAKTFSGSGKATEIEKEETGAFLVGSDLASTKSVWQRLREGERGGEVEKEDSGSKSEEPSCTTEK